MFNASEANPHGQLSVNAVSVVQVVFHVAADGLNFTKVLISHQECELHLAGLIEIDNDFGFGNAGLVGDDLL